MKKENEEINTKKMRNVEIKYYNTLISKNGKNGKKLRKKNQFFEPRVQPLK